MMVVLFIFAVLTCICCCLIMSFVRWMYKRRIRKKAELLRMKYRHEDEQRLEMENRMKEVAMRHGSVNSTVQVRIEACRSYRADLTVPFYHYNNNQSPNNKQHLPINSPIQLEPKINEDINPQNYGLFTGHTPLQSPNTTNEDSRSTPPATVQPQMPKVNLLPPTQNIVKSNNQPDSSVIGALKPDTVSNNIEMIPMEPIHIAATVHTIAKECKAAERDVRPPIPGLIVVSKKTADSEVNQNNTTDDSTSSAVTTTSKTTTIKSESTSIVTESPAPQRTETDQVATSSQILKEPNEALPYKGEYFPYWTARTFISKKFEPTTSSLGPGRCTNVTTSEQSVWALNEPRHAVDDEYAKNEDESLDDTKRSTKKPQPYDVYELRREIERLRKNEISMGMKALFQEVLDDMKKLQRPSISTPLNENASPTNVCNRPVTNTISTPPQRGVLVETKEVHENMSSSNSATIETYKKK
ncbi:hypothetical protein DICVIV_05066 [Dictyocaulus viviparus]|uniref:Uncharacterized protein n=1 Tax=Dictyocaulus viviparus TaxID=29172 RepID=A0A0D8XW08_DICVI|nr:hypothetical protein DICVIV_05066 [Dictyocaulus viviparus]